MGDRLNDPVRWVGAIAVVCAAAVLLLADRGTATPSGLERMRVYDLAAPARFALEPGEREIRLLTWLSAPPEEAVDVRRSELYALALEVDGPGGDPLLDRSVWIPTHRSFWTVEEPVPPQRVPGSDRQPWDDRTTRIDLDGLVPEGGTLTVGIAGAPAGASVLGVAFRRAEATPLVVLGRLRQRLLDRDDPVAPWPFSKLPLAWQENEARRSWERLGALPPEAGGLPATVRIETWFDRLPHADAPAIGVPVEPGGALAWLVQGPTRFEAELFAAHGPTPNTGLPEPTRDVPLGRVTALDGTAVPVAATAGRLGPIDVDGTVEILLALPASAEGPRVVRATTSGGADDRALGDPPRIRLADGRELVAPELREVQAWRVDGAPLGWSIAVDEQVRLTVRAALGPGPRPALDRGVAGTPVPVRLRTLDGAGVETGAWTVDVASIPSAFERYVRGDAAASRVGERVTVHLRPPPGSARLVVESAAPVDVTLETTADPDARWVPAPGYELPPFTPFTLVHEPFVEDPWSASAPLEVEARDRAARSIAIDGQVRLALSDPANGAEGDRTGRHALTLPGPFELLAEPDVDGTGPGARLRLGSDPVRLRPPPSGRLRVDYRVAPELVGREVLVTVGGRTVARSIPSTAGALRVDGIGTAPVEVAVDAVGLFLAEGQGSPVWQVRRVWSLPDGGERTIALPPGEVSIAIVPYRTGRGGRVRYRVEDLGPPVGGLSDRVIRRNGETRERWGTRRTAEPLSFQGGGLEPMAPIVLVRPPGSPPARVVLSAEGTGTVWVRASASWASPSADAPSHRRQGADEG